MKKIKLYARKLFHLLGFDIVRHINTNNSSQALGEKFPFDFNQEDIEIIKLVKPYTLTSAERLFGLIHAVRYVVANNIPGDIVECGVWKGGSMMATAYTLKSLNDESRKLYLFDTYEGMTEPTEKDITYYGTDAATVLKNCDKDDESSFWCRVSLDQTKKNVYSVGYNQENINFIKGKVEETIPKYAPEIISILRLDTDWYDSTYHELEHLFPHLSPGGVLIIDDYGWWKGARQATDEYLQKKNIKILLNRIDCTGRIAVKL